MASLRNSWRIQKRVVTALMIREMTTRFGRENIGFLWVMVEPLLFAGLVALMWRVMKGPEEHGVSVVAFVISGYIPLTLFRHALSKSIAVFVANGSLLYHRQVRIIDFLLARFMIEMIGGMMAFVFVSSVLFAVGLFEIPENPTYLIAGWLLYSLVTLSICFVIAPLSEVSEVLEKIIPVTTYIIIPISGTFSMVQWLTPTLREYMLWSPFVTPMEMIRYGLFGDRVTPYYSLPVPLVFSVVCLVIGLALCRRVRKDMAVE